MDQCVFELVDVTNGMLVDIGDYSIENDIRAGRSCEGIVQPNENFYNDQA